MMWWSYFTVFGLVYTLANGAPPRIAGLSNSDNDNGVNGQSTGGSGEWSTELEEAIKKAYLEKVKELINSGLDVNAINIKHDGESYLHTAATSDFRIGKITQLLLSEGAKVDAKDKFGFTPLISAAANGNYKSAKALLEMGADIEVQDTGKWQGTAILWASVFSGQKNWNDVVKLLVAKKANVNVHFKNMGVHNWYPLHFVANAGTLEMTKLLVDAGAEVNPVDGNGRTPMYLAQNGGHQEVVKYLKDNGGHE